MAFILEHEAYLCIFLIVVKLQEVGIIQAATNYAKAHPIRTYWDSSSGPYTLYQCLQCQCLVSLVSLWPGQQLVLLRQHGKRQLVLSGRAASFRGAKVRLWAGGIKVAGVAGAALTRVTDISGLVETFHQVYPTAKRAWCPRKENGNFLRREWRMILHRGHLNKKWSTDSSLRPHLHWSDSTALILARYLFNLFIPERSWHKILACIFRFPLYNRRVCGPGSALLQLICRFAVSCSSKTLP